jgi:hypothetical protein
MRKEILTRLRPLLNPDGELDNSGLRLSLRLVSRLVYEDSESASVAEFQDAQRSGRLANQWMIGPRTVGAWLPRTVDAGSPTLPA